MSVLNSPSNCQQMSNVVFTCTNSDVCSMFFRGCQHIVTCYVWSSFRALPTPKLIDVDLWQQQTAYLRAKCIVCILHFPCLLPVYSVLWSFLKAWHSIQTTLILYFFSGVLQCHRRQIYFSATLSCLLWPARETQN